MSAKTARITILGTAEFKAFLEDEARRQNISVGKLVRDRFESPSANDSDVEAEVLAAMVAEVREATARAERSLNQGLKDADATLEALRS
jgi:hypothetical protein